MTRRAILFLSLRGYPSGSELTLPIRVKIRKIMDFTHRLIFFYPFLLLENNYQKRKTVNKRIINTFLLIFMVGSLYAQSFPKKSAFMAEPVICFASPEVRKSYVPPPREFLERLKSTKKGAEIIVDYKGFPDSVRVAFEYAVSIWESLLSSAVPIYIEARWQELDSRVLANCGATDFLRDFPGAPNKGVYYPIALAEKLQRKELTGPGIPDMIARFNSTMAWYTGTDGNTPVNRYDMVSTVLHEIAHGLGFTGFFSANVSRFTGSLGRGDGIPAIYDINVQDFQRNYLADESIYPNPSQTLYSALISSQLFSGSYLGSYWNKQTRPRLYAPSAYNPGSSIYHLNSASYPYGNPNSLMTHETGRGQAIHSPGPLALGMLYDMGWKHLFFNFEPLKDVETAEGPLAFIAGVESDLGLDLSSFYLYYSYDRFKNHRDSVLFVANNHMANYSANLLPVIQEGTISYYLAASDTTGREFTFPFSYPENLFQVRIGRDTIKPVITHSPPAYVLSTDISYLLETEISDNIGVGSATAIIYRDNLEIGRRALEKREGDLYSLELFLSEWGLQSGGVLEYRITATDVSTSENYSELPSGSSFKVTVEKIMPPISGYFTDFSGGSADFIAGDFRIGSAKFFNDPALFSPTPYPSPEKDNQTFDLITMLRFPIIVKERGIISFDEVVLVEPGENGTRFGDDEFWDYVIVEATRDSGKNWLPLIDGYDSRANTAWLERYNSYISGQNSLATGTRDLYINRQFTLTDNGNFKAGDTILIRFRLFSDPYANGWGWAIDNLRIQQPVSVNLESTLSPGHIRFWPNPFRDILSWGYSADKPTAALTFEIFDLTGRLLKTVIHRDVYPGMESNVPLDDIPPGFCIVSVKADQVPVTRVKLLRQ